MRQEDPVTSTSVDTAIDDQARRLGSRIREVRRARRLTLVQLAEAADLSHPFLSQLERGLARPSMTSLEKIARALGSSQLELLAGADDDEPVSTQSGTVLVRAGDGARGAYGEGDAQLLVHGRRNFMPMLVSAANQVAGAYFRHDEDEFVHCIEGTVVVDLEGQGIHVLGSGDSLYYVGGTPHRWTAVDPTGYRLFVVKEKPKQL